jgi:hypothetical protein
MKVTLDRQCSERRYIDAVRFDSAPVCEREAGVMWPFRDSIVTVTARPGGANRHLPARSLIGARVSCYPSGRHAGASKLRIVSFPQRPCKSTSSDLWLTDCCVYGQLLHVRACSSRVCLYAAHSPRLMYFLLWRSRASALQQRYAAGRISRTARPHVPSV